MMTQANNGILFVNKPKDKTSFSLVSALRRILKTKKIGHAGTLDPFATGVMILLIGREYTRLSDNFLACGKEYVATLRLGIETDTYDCEGKVTAESGHIPSEAELAEALGAFQGDVMQVPPMYSAKKVNGKKLYELARRGVEIERKPVQVNLKTHLLRYEYPYVDLHIECSKGTYIRSVAHDLGAKLKCGAHLQRLQRTKSGNVALDACLDGGLLYSLDCNSETIKTHLIQYGHAYFSPSSAP